MSNGETIPKDINDALEIFKKESKRINDDIFKELISNKKLPPIIYHYTNDIGLRGILETGKLRLTDIFALNDPSELKHGLLPLKKAIDDEINDGHTEGKRIVEWLEVFMNKKLFKKLAFYCICSFSSCEKDLGQWRAYADNGRGFAIGFDRKILEEAFKDDGTSNQIFSTFPVVYDDTSLINAHRNRIKALFRDVPLRREEFSDDKLFSDELMLPLVSDSLSTALYFKHTAYSNEQEYRFLQLHSADPPPILKKRYRNYSLIKYREFDWLNLAPKALKEIIIGPSEDDQQKAHKFAEDCLQAAGIDSVKVIDSDIPYRAL
jgi:hypothetical protein